MPPRAATRNPDPLAAAAILGATFDTDEFIEVTGLSEPDAYAALERASAQNLLLRTDAGWEFRHALVRDALLAKVAPIPAATPAPAGRGRPAGTCTGRRPGSDTTWCRPATGPARCPG